MIESLRRKPRALLRAQLQSDLLPGENRRQLWRLLRAALPPAEAAKVTDDALHGATRTDDLDALERYRRRQLRRVELNLTSLRDHYCLRHPGAWRPCQSSTSPNTPSAAMTKSWLEPPSRPALETALPAVLKQLKLPQFRTILGELSLGNTPTAASPSHTQIWCSELGVEIAER